jgi:hypothetical protein
VVGEWLGQLASAPDWRAQAAVLPRDSGGRWGAGDARAVADKWGRVTAEPGGQWLGVGGRGSTERR